MRLLCDLGLGADAGERNAEVGGETLDLLQDERGRILQHVDVAGEPVDVALELALTSGKLLDLAVGR